MKIRPLHQGDLDAAADNDFRAFSWPSAADREEWGHRAARSVRDGLYLGGFDGDRLVASARILDLAQWWHGRAVPMAGIAGVSVAPEDRGRGAGRRIMAAVLERCGALGSPLSVLFPATTPLYREFGWEHAGAQHVIGLAAEGLRTLAAEPVPVRRPGPQDAAEVAAVLRRVHAAAADCGPLDWGEDEWRLRLDEPGGRFRYLADDGFLSYRWIRDGAALEVDKLVAGSERTLRALWAIVGSGSSIARTVEVRAAPHDPVLWLVRERPDDEVRRHPWMLRVVDAPAAVAARGFPAGVDVSAPLVIEDPLCPGNTGSWRLTVSGGAGGLEPAGAAAERAVRLGPRGLAALYAGAPVGVLRRSGLLGGGDPGTDAALGAAFGGVPFTLDAF
ncbi:GNAT family N-acetyltransferase [Actinomadura craniellae]|uniref:GNAT family N-acetyltransferase n=1 Tax=Actinomadura craniellae TaxID=2231787 RepID=A0A365HDK4_9ACTN|nr:GNAT family N-acetyltransferase [Actinomadura craniellae]RAY17210.1 GNAT family N-acetyltransferase [Actinomadura craniellae]